VRPVLAEPEDRLVEASDDLRSRGEIPAKTKVEGTAEQGRRAGDEEELRLLRFGSEEVVDEELVEQDVVELSAEQLAQVCLIVWASLEVDAGRAFDLGPVAVIVDDADLLALQVLEALSRDV